ncbi:hypothetical protein DFH28DRAFT_1215731 [Melampsora americana]|nr:hypothetical protein DFH28DRAFT_1215731 [Melampsora americana]
MDRYHQPTDQLPCFQQAHAEYFSSQHVPPETENQYLDNRPSLTPHDPLNPAFEYPNTQSGYRGPNHHHNCPFQQQLYGSNNQQEHDQSQLNLSFDFEAQARHYEAQDFDFERQYCQFKSPNNMRNPNIMSAASDPYCLPPPSSLLPRSHSQHVPRVSTVVPNPPSQSSSKRPRASQGSERTMEPSQNRVSIALPKTAKRLRTNKAISESDVPSDVPLSTQITQSAFINGFLPKSLIGPNTQLPTEIPTYEEMMKLSAIELATLASKHSKKMVWGKRLIYRGYNGYNVFQASKQATKIVKDNGGIKAPGTNKKVGDAWRGLSFEVQEYYHAQAAESVRLARLKKSKSNNVNSNSANTSEATLALSSASSSSNPATQSNVDSEVQLQHNLITPSSPISTTQDHIESEGQSDISSSGSSTLTTQGNVGVESWLSDLLPQANNMAETYKVQIAFICVSTYLGEGNIQIVEATPCLRAWFQLERMSNLQNHTIARIQSAVTGRSVDELAKMGPVFQPDEISKARMGLSQLISTGTEDKIQKFPWTNKTRLRKLGYEIRLLPGAYTSMDILNRASNKLLPAKAMDINKSLREHMLRVVKVEPTDIE